MRCEKCSSLNHINFSHNADYLPHHESFTDVQQAAADGCEMCKIFVWNCRLHPSQPGVYDVAMKDARAAKGLIRLTRRGVQFGGPASNPDRGGQLDFEICGNVSDKSPNFIVSSPLTVDVAQVLPSEVPHTYNAQTVKPQILQWLEECDTAHQSCCDLRLSMIDRRGPARLLYLGTTSASHIHLLSTFSKTPTYAALSYVWGPEPHGATTTKSNLAERLQDVPIDNLPQVYQDAIELCRELGICYLWIDALCIIQPDSDGDDQDWQGQSEIMGIIYANAYVTIAAAATTSANDKLFGSGRIVQNTPPPCRLFEDGAGLKPPFENPWLAAADLFWVTMISFNNLQSRGWCFQERLLSRRIIHLTRYEACWECHGSAASEHYPNGVPPSESTNVLMRNEYGCWRRIPRPNTSAVTLSEGQKLDLLQKLWPNMIHRYTGRHLSMHTDILPAVSAAAKVIHNATGADYLAGFWRPVAVADLAWAGDVNSTLNRQGKFRSRPRDDSDLIRVKVAATNPSWSWSSVRGTVNPFIISNPSAPEEERAEILEISVKPLFASNPFGQLDPTSTRLILRGLLRKGARRADVHYRRAPSGDGDPHQYMCSFAAERMDSKPGVFRGKGFGLVTFDVLEEALTTDQLDLFLLLERQEERGSKLEAIYHKFTAMAIVKCHEQGNNGDTLAREKYRRVGLTRSFDHGMFDEDLVEEVVISIV